MKLWLIWLGAWIGGLVLGLPSLWADEVPPMEFLLPKTTAGCIAVTNVEELIESWNKTQLGHLANDELMEPFVKDVRRQFEDRWTQFHEKLGLSLEEMRELAGGEAVAALIRPAPAQAAHVLVVDVTGRLEQAQQALKKVSENLLRQKAVRKQRTVAGKSMVVFELPPKDKSKDEAPRHAPELKPKKTTSVEPTRIAVYCLTGNLLVAADGVEIVEGVLKRQGGARGDALADNPGFKAVMERCQRDAGEAKPQVRWFIHPVHYADAKRAATAEEQRRKGRSLVDLLQNQGFSAIEGVGGHIAFAAEGFELIHRTAVHAPPPYEKSMKMLVFPNGRDFKPQRWVPRDIATYTTFYIDLVNAFDNVGPLYDEIFGKGEEGIWQEVLEGLATQPDGPQVDLRKDLIVYLGPRITMLTDYQTPITTASERLLFAIETKNDETVAAAVAKLMQSDENARKRDVDGLVVWEMVEPEDAKPLVPVVTLPGMQSTPPPGLKSQPQPESKLLPHAAITVTHGHLLCASHMDFLHKILKHMREPNPLDRDVSYRLVETVAARIGPKERCGRFFSFTDEEYRPTYELIRQNKMPQSESLLGRLLNTFSDEGKRGELRKPKIDGSKLPEYDVVRRHLGPAGMVVTSEPTGWFLKGFTLAKQ